MTLSTQSNMRIFPLTQDLIYNCQPARPRSGSGVFISPLLTTRIPTTFSFSGAGPFTMIWTKLVYVRCPPEYHFYTNPDATESAEQRKEKEERKVAEAATSDPSTLTVRLQQSVPFRSPKAWCSCGQPRKQPRVEAGPRLRARSSASCRIRTCRSRV